jgi:maltose O-acetyltransferase
VTVGNNVWVGANCVLLPGITIGDNSLIAAGSVVSRDVPPNEIWGGVPARKLKDVPAPEQARA